VIYLEFKERLQLSISGMGRHCNTRCFLKAVTLLLVLHTVVVSCQESSQQPGGLRRLEGSPSHLNDLVATRNLLDSVDRDLLKKRTPPVVYDPRCFNSNVILYDRTERAACAAERWHYYNNPSSGSPGRRRRSPALRRRRSSFT